MEKAWSRAVAHLKESFLKQFDLDIQERKVRPLPRYSKLHRLQQHWPPTWLQKLIYLKRLLWTLTRLKTTTHTSGHSTECQGSYIYPECSKLHKIYESRAYDDRKFCEFQVSTMIV